MCIKVGRVCLWVGYIAIYEAVRYHLQNQENSAFLPTFYEKKTLVFIPIAIKLQWTPSRLAAICIIWHILTLSSARPILCLYYTDYQVPVHRFRNGITQMNKPLHSLTISKTLQHLCYYCSNFLFLFGTSFDGLMSFWFPATYGK